MRNATVYRPCHDCTNGGITSPARVPTVEMIRVFEEGEQLPMKPTVRDFYEENRSHLTGGSKHVEAPHWAAIPLVRMNAAVDGVKGGLIGPMFGGNLAIAEFDGKPTRIYRVHDRFESPKLTAMLTDILPD